MNTQTILLLVPAHVGLIEPITLNLQYHNFIVSAFSNGSLTKDFQFPNFRSRAKSFLLKNIYQDRRYKEKLKQNWMANTLTKQLENKTYDYALVIRPDIFSKKCIHIIREHTKKHLVAYHWDGIKRFPDVIDYVQLFNDFFVFDTHDIADYSNISLKGITNFYFDMLQPKTVTPSKNPKAYFLGSHIPSRIHAINTCAHSLYQHHITVDFHIATRKKKYQKFYDKQVQFIKKTIVFLENLAMLNQVDILVDFCNPVHQGLSFRVFEALYYRKKLITDNPTVKYYDFYHPDNIYIWDGKTMPGLAEFLARPMHEVDAEIVHKYSFGNWIRQVLDLPPYQRIELPVIPDTHATQKSNL